MGAFARSSSRAGLLALTALAACVDHQPGVEGTTSLHVELIAPTDPGSEDQRLPDTQRTVTFNVTALDAQGQPDSTVNGDVDLYVHFLGSLTPPLDQGVPLIKVTMTDGASGDVNLDLPRAFGATYLWVEDTSRDGASYATGTSPTLWYRNVHIEDIQRPVDEMALDALERSPLELKQIDVTASRYGDAGRLVVTGTYAQGYTVSDVQCADAAGTPPCVAGDYDHAFVFSYSRPADQNGQGLVRGEVVTRFNGAVSEFNGLTEINFPRSFVDSTDAMPALLPEPAVIQSSWLSSRIEMERNEAGLVAVENATICALDADYDSYKQWKLDLGLGCNNPVNVITSGQVPDFDPATYVGQVMPRVVGTLRPVNIGSFNVWIIYPRDIDDVTLPAGN